MVSGISLKVYSLNHIFVHNFEDTLVTKGIMAAELEDALGLVLVEREDGSRLVVDDPEASQREAEGY